MIICNFNIIRIVVVPFKANPPLVINPNAVLTLSVTMEGF